MTGPAASPDLPLSTRLAYAVGTAGMTALIASTSFFLLIFLTDVALLPAATVGSALLVAKLWDTVNDPLLGWYLDRTRHRWPLRRWLYVGALPLALTTAALWFIPSGLSTTARVVWVVAAYLLFDTFFTATQLAFSALCAEATTEYDARTRFVAFGAIGGVLGYGLGASAIDVAKRFVSTPALAYTLGGVAMGVLAAVGLGLAGRYVRPHRPPPPASAPAGRILDALREKPFVMLAVATGASRLGFTMVSVGLPYYAKYHLHDERLAARLVMVLMVVIAVMVPVWRRAGLRSGKAKAYAASLGLVSVVLLASWLVPAGDTGLAYVLVALVGVGMAGHWVLPWAILPDVVDDAEARTGTRQLGVFYGAYGLVDKLARTVGFVSVGWLLGAAGFEPNVAQAGSAALAIRAVFGPVPGLLLLAALPFLIRFPLDRRAHEAVRARLEGRAVHEEPLAAEPPSLLRRLFTRVALSFFKVPRDAVRFGLRRFGPRVAITSPGGAITTSGRALTFATLEERVLRLASALEARGVGPGSLVLSALDDGPELLELRYATLEMGAKLGSIAPWAEPVQVMGVARLGTPAFLFFDARLPGRLKAALAQLPLAGDRRVETGHEWEALLASAPARRSHARLAPSSLAAVGFTSGTTGTPKVLGVSHGALMKSLALTAINVRAPVGQDEVLLSAIPLNGAGSGLVLPLALTGARLVIAASVEPAALVHTLRAEGVTRMFLTPSQLLDLLDEDGFTRARLPALRNIIYGTAAMPVPRLEEALEKLGPIFQQGYGMAEVLPPVSLLQMEHHVVGGAPAPREVLRSVGWVVPQVRVRVVDEALRDVEPGQVGEVLVDSPTVFASAWEGQAQDASVSVFHEGFLRTGDFGVLTADGRLTVLDRRADLLRWRGRTLYPRLLEEAAYAEATVKEACVVQAAAEEPPVLFVSPRKGRTVDVASLRRHLEVLLTPVERPEELRVLDALPRSRLQKLLRREVRAMLQAEASMRLAVQ